MNDSERQDSSTPIQPPTTLSEALECLKQAIASFERYESAIDDALYMKTIAAVHRLRAISDQDLNEPETIDQLVSFFANTVFPQADDTYVRLAAYQPYRKSIALERLRERQTLVQHLRKLASTVQERIASAGTGVVVG